jgi:hypothetical protein
VIDFIMGPTFFMSTRVVEDFGTDVGLLLGVASNAALPRKTNLRIESRFKICSDILF